MADLEALEERDVWDMMIETHNDTQTYNYKASQEDFDSFRR